MSEAMERVRYYDGQVLSAKEFVDEQAYHVEMRRLHTIGLHSMGIVSGLVPEVSEGRISVTAGLGVDGFGRELVLAERREIPGTVFSDRASDVLEVWLAYDRVPAAGNVSAHCETGSPARWQESPRIELRVPDPYLPLDPLRPKGVKEGDLDLSPGSTPPDDPARYFPLFLGRISRGIHAGDSPGVDLSQRPYVGLVGGSLRAPSGKARLQIGAESDSDPNSIAVFLESGAMPLAVRQDGSILIDGRTTVGGDLEVAGTLALEPGGRRAKESDAARMFVFEDEFGRNELRVELPESGSSAVAIGMWGKPADPRGGPEGFMPVLTVHRDGVQIEGNLVVDGEIRALAGLVSEGLDARAAELVTAMFLSGLAEGPPFADVQLLADALAADPSRATALVADILERHTELADILRDALGDSGPG